MIIETKKLKDLKPAPYNPRTSTEEQEQNLAKSLEKFGVVEPVIFNKRTGYIVGGHFRVRELQKLGFKEVECVIVDLSEEDEKELNIRLNSNIGSWDWDKLNTEFDAVDLEDWGLSQNLEDFSDKNKQLDFVTHANTQKYIIKLGFSEEDYLTVKSKLEDQEETPEQIFLNALI